jgi:hypothetical protein
VQSAQVRPYLSELGEVIPDVLLQHGVQLVRVDLELCRHHLRRRGPGPGGIFLPSRLPSVQPGHAPAMVVAEAKQLLPSARPERQPKARFHRVVFRL